MIDVSNVILREVKAKVTAGYPDCYFTTSNPDSVTQNRVISMTEVDNYTYRKSLDGENKEHHAHVVFQFDVYSNNTTGKKAEAKAMMNLVDEAMMGMRFVRTFCQPMSNLDRSYYRITARYEAIIEADKTEDGDTINQIYRR